MPEVISRKDARTAGLSHYFTGVPCKHGHLLPKTVKNKRCPGCNRLYAKINGKRWELKNLDNIKKYRAEWREKNKTKIIARSRAYNAANKEKRYPVIKKWREENKGKVKFYASMRKALKRNASGKHTHKDILEIYSSQKGRCAYFSVCRTELGKDYHVDHIVAISNGGGNGRDNIQLTCPTCNLTKNARHPIEFAQSIGLLL